MMSLFISLLVSQNLFARTFGGTGNDQAFSIIQTTDGGFAVAGYTASFGAGGWDILVLKLSPTGLLEWARTFGGTGSDHAFSIIQTTDGGFAVAGWTGSFGAGGNDLIVLKLNLSGTLAWAKTVGTTADDYGYSITQIADGGFVVAGGTTYTDANEMDILVIKLASDGSYLWGKTLGDLDEYDCANSVISTSDGGAAVVGDLYSYPSGAIALKLASNGSLTWTAVMGGYFTRGLSVTQTTDNGLVVAMQQSTQPGFRIGKLTSGGSAVWFRVLGGLTSDVPYFVARTSDGGVAVAGIRYIGSAYDIVVFKLSSDGSSVYGKTFGGSNYDYSSSIVQTQSGGFAVAGYTASFGAGNNDFLVLTMDASGNYPGCVQDYPLTSSSYGSTTPPYTAQSTPSLSTLNPTLTTNIPSLSIADVCPPVELEEISPGPQAMITCSPVPGGALFLSPEDMAIKLYSSDGRLAYSGQLEKGENRVKLETGVHLWQAGAYRGTVVVR